MQNLMSSSKVIVLIGLSQKSKMAAKEDHQKEALGQYFGIAT